MEQKCQFCSGSGVIPTGEVTPLEENDVCYMCDGSGLFKKEKFTCNTCLSKDDCAYAWDLYNTNGDCLASK